MQKRYIFYDRHRYDTKVNLLVHTLTYYVALASKYLQMEDVFSLKIRNYQKVLHNYDSSTYAIGLEYHDFPSEIMKLFTCGGKYCSTVAE